MTFDKLVIKYNEDKQAGPDAENDLPQGSENCTIYTEKYMVCLYMNDGELTINLEPEGEAPILEFSAHCNPQEALKQLHNCVEIALSLESMPH